MKPSSTITGEMMQIALAGKQKWEYEKGGYAIEFMSNPLRRWRQWDWRIFKVDVNPPCCVCESYSEWTKSDAFNSATKWIDNELAGLQRPHHER